MSRFLGTLLFTVVILVAVDSHAQCQRGAVVPDAPVRYGERHYDTRHLHDQFYNRRYPPLDYWPTAPGYYGSRAWHSYVPADVYPKYYGGFHSRHFNNIGVPPGDIGLRGNGIYWSPW